MFPSNELNLASQSASNFFVSSANKILSTFIPVNSRQEVMKQETS
jgi:hypothetical protein